MAEVTNSGIIQTGGHLRIKDSAIGGNATVQPDDAARPRNHPRPAVRLCLAADVEKFSRRRTPAAARTQSRLIEVLARARGHAGIDESAVELQHSGDGQFAVLPAGLDESTVLPALVDGLEIALLDVNADLSEQARLRIRVALHRGHVSPGVAGWIGDSAIAVHRLLDAPALRQALRDDPATDFALIVPDLLYRDVIAHHYGRLHPEAFHQVTIDLPDKGFTEHAWIYLP